MWHPQATLPATFPMRASPPHWPLATPRVCCPDAFTQPVPKVETRFTLPYINPIPHQLHHFHPAQTPARRPDPTAHHALLHPSHRPRSDPSACTATTSPLRSNPDQKSRRHGERAHQPRGGQQGEWVCGVSQVGVSLVCRMVVHNDTRRRMSCPGRLSLVASDISSPGAAVGDLFGVSRCGWMMGLLKHFPVSLYLPRPQSIPARHFTL